MGIHGLWTHGEPRGPGRAGARLALLALTLLVAAGAVSGQGLGADQRSYAALEEATLASGRGELDRARALLEVELGTEPRSVQFRPWILLRLASLERAVGEYATSMERFDEAVRSLPEDWRESPQWVETAFTLYGERGEAHLELGRADRAARDFEFAHELLAELPAVFALHSLYRRTNLYVTLEAYEVALELVDEALRHDALAGQPALEAVFLARRGVALVELEREGRGPESGEARAALEEALSHPELLGLERTRAQLTLAELHRLRGEFDAARALLASVRERTESRTDALDHAAVGMRILADSVEAAVALDVRAPRAELEDVRARLSVSVTEFLDSWRRLPPLPAGVGFLGAGSHRNSISSLISLTLALEDEAKAGERVLDVLLEAQSAGSMTRESGAPATDLETLRERLFADGSGALVYYGGTDRSHVVCVDERTISVFEFADEDSLQPANRELRSLLASPPAAFGGEDGQRRRAGSIERRSVELAAEVLPAAVQVAIGDWATVYVVGNELFGYLPFEALPLEDGRLFGHVHAVAHLPSLPLGAHLAGRGLVPVAPGEAGLELGLVAAPEHGEEVRGRWPELERLPATGEQLASLRAPFAASAVLERAEATLPGLTALLAAEPAVVEFVAHGVNQGEEAGLALLLAASDGHDGRLDAAAIEELAWPPAVVLFACGAGDSAVRRGDDRRTDLGGALLAAGAQAVLLSPAEQSFPSVLELAKPLNEALAAGASPAEALRRARVAAARQAATADPYYHATMQVVGLGARPVLAPRDSQGEPGREPIVPLGLLASIAIGVALAIAIAWRRGRGA